MALTRRPYQYPRFEGDDQFMGTRKTEIYPSKREQVEVSNPHHRLYSARTLSSLRREATYFDPQASNDSLDFLLKAEYNNHREFLKDRNEIVLQRETLGETGGRKLKNRKQARAEPALGHPLRTVCSERREDKNSVKNTISGHHSQTTNVGYSRKPDGGFYTS